MRSIFRIHIILNKIFIVVDCRSDRLLVMLRSMLKLLSAQSMFTYEISHPYNECQAALPFS